VARKNPATREELAQVSELRRWQADVLGEDFLKALATHRGAGSVPSAPAAPRRAARSEDDSPYSDYKPM
jgi:hypothetical protein